MTDQTKRDYRQEFLVTAAAWEANPARRAEELRDPARRMIYRCLRTFCGEAVEGKYPMPAPYFSGFTRERIYDIIMAEIRNYDSATFKHRGEGGRHRPDDKHAYYAGLALRSADPGSPGVPGDDASQFESWTQAQYDVWFLIMPIRLTMADVAEAWKGRDRCADDPWWPKPTPVPCTGSSSGGDDCCTFEEWRLF